MASLCFFITCATAPSTSSWLTTTPTPQWFSNSARLISVLWSFEGKTGEQTKKIKYTIKRRGTTMWIQILYWLCDYYTCSNILIMIQWMVMIVTLVVMKMTMKWSDDKDVTFFTWLLQLTWTNLMAAVSLASWSIRPSDTYSTRRGRWEWNWRGSLVARWYSRLPTFLFTGAHTPACVRYSQWWLTDFPVIIYVINN